MRSIFYFVLICICACICANSIEIFSNRDAGNRECLGTTCCVSQIQASSSKPEASQSCSNPRYNWMLNNQCRTFTESVYQQTQNRCHTIVVKYIQSPSTILTINNIHNPEQKDSPLYKAGRVVLLLKHILRI